MMLRILYHTDILLVADELKDDECFCKKEMCVVVAVV
jgi:hypothetical protein